MTETSTPPVSFPRLSARTMNFQLGLPRGFVVSPDGGRVVFLRTDSPTSRTHALWVYDVATATERCVADPVDLLASGSEELTAEERARRERMRVGTAGVVAFSTDDAVTRAVFALSSRLFVADLAGDQPARELPVSGPVIDPRIDPTGTRVAYADGRSVHVADIDAVDARDRLIAGPADDDPAEVVWGLAEFIAGEELDRTRGFWWAPDGGSLLIERYDETPVPVWYISDPANPASAPNAVRYPQAGTSNALVSLWLVDLDGTRTPLDWSSDAELDGVVLEYLAEVTWAPGSLLLALLTRDQKRLEFRAVDTGTGATTLLRALTDDAFPRTPARHSAPAPRRSVAAWPGPRPDRPPRDRRGTVHPARLAGARSRIGRRPRRGGHGRPDDRFDRGGPPRLRRQCGPAERTRRRGVRCVRRPDDRGLSAHVGRTRGVDRGPCRRDTGRRDRLERRGAADQPARHLVRERVARLPDRSALPERSRARFAPASRSSWTRTAARTGAG